MEFCKDSGLITSVTVLGKKKIPLNQQFYWYNGNGAGCAFNSTGSSGVYAFNPLKDSSIRMKIGTENVTLFKGIKKKQLLYYLYRFFLIYKEDKCFLKCRKSSRGDPPISQRLCRPNYPSLQGSRLY